MGTDNLINLPGCKFQYSDIGNFPDEKIHGQKRRCQNNAPKPGYMTVFKEIPGPLHTFNEHITGIDFPPLIGMSETRQKS